jgi:hypothetical protein
MTREIEPLWRSPKPVTRTLIPRPRSPWGAVGYALAVIVAVAGLAYLAVMVLAFVALSQSGSNK